MARPCSPIARARERTIVDSGRGTIRIKDFKFVPDTEEVNAGDVVEWKNEDFVAHTATADDHSFDTGPIEGGSSKRVAMRRKGRFSYSCRYHPTMKGTLVVR